jgi:hypothetical protein
VNRALLALAVAVAGLSTVPAAGAAATDGPDPLRAAARVNQMTVPELRGVLEDPTMRLGDNGRLYAADPLHEATEAAAGSAPTQAQQVAPLDQTFLLHSKPGSDHTIYLDFDGVTLTPSSAWVGGAWPSGSYDGFDLDDDRSTFSLDERSVIQDVWARVTDDFASFDVDVTTEEPTTGQLVRTSEGDPTYGMRVAITDDPDAKLAACAPDPVCSTVGLAWVGIFNDVNAAGTERYGPAWALSDFGGDSKLIAETINHEVGHTLGLQHASSPVPSALFAPTMYPSISSAAVTHWISPSPQDERAVITSTGLPLRADDYPDTVGAAASLTSTNRSGIVSTPADKDVFLVPGCAAGATLSARPADAGPNLDIVLTVQPDTGSPIVAAPATTETAGMDASVTLPAASASTYLSVDGGGSGAGGSTGEYSDYGSVGAYTLDVVGCNVPTVAPSAPRSVSATTTGSTTTLTWKAPSTTGGNGTLSYQVALDGGAWEAASGATSHSWNTSSGRHRVSVRAVGAQAGPAVETLSITPPTTPISAWFETHGSPGARYLHWNLPPGGGGGAPLTQLKLTAVSGASGTWSLNNPTSGSFEWGPYVPDGSTWTVSLANAAGAGGERRVVVRATPVAPGAPTALALSGTVPADGTATIGWTRPVDDGGRPLSYEVRLDDGDWLPVGGAETSYTFDDVPPGTRTAEIRSVTSAGSTAAAPIEFEMVSGPAAPGVVPEVAVSVDSPTQVATVSWGTPESSSPLTAYVVTVDDTPQTLDCDPTCPDSVDLAPMPRGSEHTVTVQGVNEIGTGPAGSGIDFTIPALAPDTVTGIVVGHPSSTSLSVTWDTPADNGAAIDHYTVQVGTHTVEITAPTTTTTVTGLQPGQTYPISVSATNAVDTGPAGTTTGTVPAVRPGAPRQLKSRPGARGGAVTIALVWRAPASTGGAALTSYRIVGYQLDKRGRITTQRTWTVAARNFKTELKVTKGVRMRFAIQVANKVGWSSLTAKSAPVTGR